jgi:hypothetical protein
MTRVRVPDETLDHARSLQRLFAAARVGDDSTAHAILAWVERDGTLAVSDDEGPMQPAASVLPELRRVAAGRPAPWLLPCVVKPVQPQPGVAAALSVVARELNARRGEDHVETHIVAGVAVSYFVDGHVSLRSLLLARGPDDDAAARSVHTTCVERLLDYVDYVDPHIQSALRSAGEGVAEPTAFDYAGRLRRATVQLEDAVGAPPTIGSKGSWDDVAALCACPSARYALFYDPKPANFLTPTSTLRTGRPGRLLYKVDIDWMLTLGPVAHQALVAVLSHPVRVSAPSSPAAALTELSAFVRSMLAPADAGPDQLDALLVYHLYRNYASKLTTAPTQARVLGPLLSAALERLRAVEVPAGAIELVAACERLPAAA